jgi:ATP-dependent Clp protease ATP-binding subunit ClpA
MLDRFQQDARAAVGHARQEAARLGKRAVGTEHLLLGLLARPGHAADALKAAGADPDSLRAQVPGADAVPAGAPSTGFTADPIAPVVLDPAAAQPIPAGGLIADPAAPAAPAAPAGTGLPGEPAPTIVVPPLTENATRAVEVALAEAERLQHPHVATGHLLLGIIDQPDSQAVQMLKIGGIHVGMLRADLLHRMEGGHNPWPR